MAWSERPIFNGLVSGMVEVGKMFEAQEYFVPSCSCALTRCTRTRHPEAPREAAGPGVKGSS